MGYTWGEAVAPWPRAIPSEGCSWEDSPSIWGTDAKALKMQRWAEAPVPTAEEGPASQGRPWEPGWKVLLFVTSRPGRRATQPPTPLRIPQGHRLPILRPPATSMSQPVPCRGANGDIKAVASRFQEALKHTSEMAVPRKIKTLPIEASEGLRHQNRVGGLTDRKTWSAIVHQAVGWKSQNKNIW